MGPLYALPVEFQAVILATAFAAITMTGLRVVRLGIAPERLRVDVAGFTLSDARQTALRLRQRRPSNGDLDRDLRRMRDHAGVLTFFPHSAFPFPDD
jgi:hypothetical protein